MKFNLDNLVKEFESLEESLTNPEIFKDQKKVKEVSSRKKQIEESVLLYKDYKNYNKSLDENKEMLNIEKDEEMRELLKLEINDLEEKINDLEERIKVALLPKDLNDDKNIIVEVRA